MTDRDAVAALLRPGQVVLLTTHAPGDVLRTRPVTLLVGTGPEVPLVMTSAGAEKVDQVLADAHVSIAGPAPTGWFSAECTARVTRDGHLLAEAEESAGIPDSADVARAGLLLYVQRMRRWHVGSDAWWDNTVEELVGAQPATEGAGETAGTVEGPKPEWRASSVGRRRAGRR